MAEDNEELARKFLDWCTKEMRYRPHGRHANTPLPDLDQTKQLLRGQGSSVVKYLITRVRSKETVKKIKGNILLFKHNQQEQSVETDEERKKLATLSDYHDKLAQDVAAKQAQVAIVEKDLQRLDRDVMEAEKSYQVATENIEEYRRKAAIVQLTSHQVHTDIAMFDDLKTKLQVKTKMLIETAQKPVTKMYMKERCGEGGPAQNLETACTKAVRETCLEIGSFLHQLLHGKFADSMQTLTARKDTLQTVVNDVCTEFPPSQLVVSLSVYAQDTTIELREKTARVDIKKDAERLRFKLEGNGVLKDAAETPNVIDTVTSLVEEAHRDNIHRFMMTEKSRNNAAKLSEKLRLTKEPVIQHLTRSYRGNDTGLDLAKSFFEKEMQIAVSRSNIAQLDKFADELKKKVGRAVQDQEMLYAKYQKIQDFTGMVDKKQNLIRVLVKQNLNAPHKLAAQQQKIIEYMQKSLCVHEPETRSHAADLASAHAKELDVFSQLLLPQLMYVTLEDASKLAVIELSINRGRSNAGSRCSQIIQEARDLLDCPAFLGAECVARQVWKLKTELVEIEEALHDSDYQWDSQVAPLVRRMTNLGEELRRLDEQQMSELMPVLQKRVELATQSLTDCLNVQDAVRFWWEQPAQHVTPWLTVDDYSYQQWCDKFTVLATRIRQMQVK